MNKAVLRLMIPFLLILPSCNTMEMAGSSAIGETVSDPFGDVDEIVHIPFDLRFHSNLRQVEEASDTIVEAVAKGVIGQHVNSGYNAQFGKVIPDFGYSMREAKVTKVYKGDVNVGDTLILLEGHYVWETDEGKRQLISRSALPPAKTDRTYLLFLACHDQHGGYWPAADWQSRFAVPDRAIREKAEANTVEQSDLDVYQHESWPYLIPIYREVYEKYFR